MRTPTKSVKSTYFKNWAIRSLALVTAIQLSAVAQTVDVIIDHAHREVTIMRRGQPDKVESGKDHTIISDDPVFVTVINTNSALFEVKYSAERPESETWSSVKTFLDKSKPYLIDLGSAALNALGSVKTGFGFGAQTYSFSDSLSMLQQSLSNELLPQGMSVSKSLQRLNALLYYSPSSVRVIELKAMEALRRLDPSNRVQFDREKEAFRTLLLSVHAFENFAFDRYTTSDSLITCWEELNSMAGALDLSVAKASNLQQTLLYTLQSDNPTSVKARLRPNASNTDSLVRELKKVDQLLAYENKFVAEAQHALNEKDAILRAASEVEHIAQATAQAKREVKLPVLRADFQKDHILRVTICQTDVAKLADFPAQSDVQYTIIVQTERSLSASLGVGMVGWLGSSFNDYAAVQTGANAYQIVRKAPDFSRFKFVTTLSILFKGLDLRPNDKVALFFPEITIGPGNELEALGLGGAVAFYKLSSKIGLGAIWVKHLELDGQYENQAIPGASALRTRKTYGRFWDDAKLYISITLFDIPPFILTK